MIESVLLLIISILAAFSLALIIAHGRALIAHRRESEMLHAATVKWQTIAAKRQTKIKQLKAQRGHPAQKPIAAERIEFLEKCLEEAQTKCGPCMFRDYLGATRAYTQGKASEYPNLAKWLRERGAK